MGLSLSCFWLICTAKRSKLPLYTVQEEDILMEHPKEIRRVVLDGRSLSLEALVAVARFGAAV